MPTSQDSEPFDRRRFLQIASLAGLGVVVPGAVALAQVPAAGGPPSPPANPSIAPDAKAPAAPPAAPAPEAISDDARAITGVLSRRYPDRLTAEQWESVMRDVDGDLASGKRLRGAKLVNADEPDVMFRA